MRRVVAVLALLVLAACTQQAKDDRLARELGGMRGELIVPVGQGYVRNGVGTTIRLTDGRLLHLVTRHKPRRGVAPDHWPADVAAMTSRDDGRTWTAPKVMFSGRGDSSAQPGLTRLKSGELGVSYSRIFGPAKAHKVFRWSKDEGRTWSDEIVMGPADGYWTSAHDRLLTLSSGRLVTPLHMKLKVSPEKIVTRVAWSDDDGRTWQVSPQTVNVEAMIPAYAARTTSDALPSFWEATIAERRDGSLLMLGRTYAGALYATTSRDGGRSWTPPRATTLYTGAAPGRLERLPDGTLVVIWNRCCLNPDSALLGRRITLSSAISRDDGETWEGPRDLEAISPVGRVEYPSVLLDADRLFVTYRAQGKTLPDDGSQEYLSVLPVAWFTADALWHRPETALQQADLPSPTSAP